MECDGLGLFATRIPRFTQLFFYEFTEDEIFELEGQPEGGLTSWRAARAYLDSSGIRLESTCGISEVWYRYLENHEQLFGFDPSTPPSEQELDPPHPYVKTIHLRSMWEALEWETQHKALLKEGYATIGSQDGQPIDGATAGPSAASQQAEEISEYTEKNGSREGSPLEESEEAGGNVAEHIDSQEERRDEARGDPEGDGTEGQTVAGIVKEDSYDFGWEMTASFSKALGKGMDEIERVSEVPYAATGAFVPSSIPEERELYLDPTSVNPTHGLDRADPVVEDPMEVAGSGAEEVEQEDRMEGVEASQQSEVLICMDRSVSSASGEDGSEMDTGEEERVADRK